MNKNEPPPKQNRSQKAQRVLQVVRPLLVIAGSVVLVLAIDRLIVLIQDAYSTPWTGFGESTHLIDPKHEFTAAKTLWDWLQLLIIPVVLTVGALLFSQADKKTEREIAEKREQTNRDIASDSAQEALLQSYLDRMTELLLEKGLRTAEVDSEVRAVAQARTITVLRRLNRVPRASLLTFLKESKLIGKDGVRLLMKVDLSNADLNDADLGGADLSGADLIRVNLSGAHLSKAYLNDAYLIKANLGNADLSGANLSGAHLNRANLSGAILGLANLNDAYLSEADLSGANLQNARVEEQQLKTAKSLKGATMPDGTKHE